MTLLRLTLTACVQDAACFSSFKHSRSIRPSQYPRSSQAPRSGVATIRLFSASDSAATANAVDSEEPPMLHPEQFGKIPYPKALSPSAVMEFKKCPQSFLFQYLYKLRQPTSLALAKGSMCHEALEKVFDLDPQDRTLEHLQNLLRVSWGGRRLKEEYRFLFETDSGDRDIDAERTWGKSALQLLENYYQIEDPRKIDRANPLKREIWLNAHLTVDPSHGTTATATAAEGGASPSKGGRPPTFHVRGIVDRLDMVRLSPRQVAIRVVDYKTGKAPNLKYSKPVNDRIMEEAFYQLKIYALLLREKGAGAEQPKGMDLRLLRLLFLTSEQGIAQNLDFDLGETQEERDMVLQEVHQDLSNVWADITELVSQQDPKAFVGCDRSFCYCHKCRERFVPDSVWGPN
jgi:RecB family exonuclease